MKLFVVTPGDPDGIGSEVVWKSILNQNYRSRDIGLLCVGARAAFERLSANIVSVTPSELDSLSSRISRAGTTPTVWLLEAPTVTPKKSPFLPGYQCGWSIETATKIALRGLASALVTGPISKERLQKGGYPFPGHTEMLASLCKRGRKVPEVTMMLANSKLRVSLVTIHTSLKNVPKELSRASLRRCVVQTVSHLQSWWKIKRPRIAVAGLNPHAGENGLLGHEEIQLIEPELKAIRKRMGSDIDLVGPLPADTLFAKHILAEPRDRFDAVVCMYHDQGLIPVKLLDFPRTVNVTLGLPIVRTSVDHGVGFDIAWQNRADPSSFQAAVDLADQIT